MARFLLILLALVAAALPLFAHAYAFETLDGARGTSVEAEVMAVNMALAGFPVALAALISHRRRAFRFGLLAFAIEAVIWAIRQCLAGRCTRRPTMPAPPTSCAAWSSSACRCSWRSW